MATMNDENNLNESQSEDISDRLTLKELSKHVSNQKSQQGKSTSPPKQNTKKFLKNLEATLKQMGQFGKKLKDTYSKEDLLKLYLNKIPIKNGQADESIDFIRLLLENRENVLNII